MPYPTFQEHEDSPKESGDRSGKYTFTRIFLTAWNDRFDFIAEHYKSGPYGLPASYSPQWAGILADTFEISRISNLPSGSVSDPNYDIITHDGTLAVITITYTPIEAAEREAGDPQNPEEPTPLPVGTWCTYTQRSNVEFRSVPGRGCKWLSDDALLPADINQQVPDCLTNHQVTWNQVRTVPWKTLGNMKGTVNSEKFRIPGSPQVFAPETLLFDGMEDEVTLTTDGQFTTRKIVLTFIEKAQKAFTSSARGGADNTAAIIYGWNHQYRPDTSDYDKVLSADSSETMFQTFNFNTLWTSQV
jgi:hypothetical protein